MPDDLPNDAPIAEAIALLNGNAPGLLLLGPPSRTARALRLIREGLDRSRFLPVTARPDSDPDKLRRDTARIHEARPGADTALLLMVGDADQLSPAMRRELADAAEAVAAGGGLKLLLAAEHDPRPGFIRDGHAALGTVLARTVAVPAVPMAAHPASEAGAIPRGDARALPPRSAPLVAAEPPRPPRTGRLVLIALLAVIVAAGVIVALVPNHRAPTTPSVAPPSAAAPVPEPASPAPPPVVSPVAPPPPADSVAPTAATNPPAVAAPSVSPAPPPTPATAPARAPAPMPAPAPASTPAPQNHSLLLVASPGDTLRGLYAQVYRSVAQPPSFGAVAALNPDALTLPIPPGTRLVFPPPAVGWPDASRP